MSLGQKTHEINTPFNIIALAKWMSEQKSVKAIIPSGDLSNCLTVRQFGFGQSNPTYLLLIQSSPSIKYVLRKKPNQVAHKSAHAIHREYRVLKSIQKYNSSLGMREKDRSIPIPNPIAYCSELQIIGSEFYIMEFVEGRIFVDPSLPELNKAERAIAYKNAIKILSNIHMMPHEKFGLGSFGRRGKFVRRQLLTLSKVMEAQAQTVDSIDGIEEISSLLELASTYCPDESNLIHGDFKVDNLIFHPTQPRIIGVIDWELSSVGDPLCDVANFSMIFFMPGIDAGFGIAGLGEIDLRGTGIPTRSILIKLYSEATNFDRNMIMMWRGFYLAFLFYKNCVIVHGVKQRSALGVASNRMAEKVATLLPQMLEMAKTVYRNEPPPLYGLILTTKSKI